MAFWSDYHIDPNGKGFEPKRKHTFLLTITGLPGGDSLTVENYLIKKVKKPGFEITESEHHFLNHTFYYPGKVKWKEVEFVVVDAIFPNTTQLFLQLLERCGYHAPAGPVDPGNINAQTVSKNRSVESLGIPKIIQLDGDGKEVERWNLRGAWVKDVDFGELNYDEEDLMNISVKLRYDFAVNEIKRPFPAKFPSNTV